jgi:hypothetical protein
MIHMVLKWHHIDKCNKNCIKVDVFTSILAHLNSFAPFSSNWFKFNILLQKTILFLITWKLKYSCFNPILKKGFNLQTSMYVCMGNKLLFSFDLILYKVEGYPSCLTSNNPIITGNDGKNGGPRICKLHLMMLIIW